MIAPKKKILIVDDEPGMVELLQACLPSRRYEVLTAQDGAEALQVARNEHPDLILVDLLMPKMDGYELLKHLEGGADTHNIPTVVLTAVQDTSSILRAQNLGARDYLLKPFHVEDVPKVVARHI